MLRYPVRQSWLLLLALPVMGVAFFAGRKEGKEEKPDRPVSRCVGAADCSACRTCARCEHCAKAGGTCGVKARITGGE